jgi:hypothetical protein
MGRSVSQQAFLNISSLRHIGEVCVKPAKSQCITYHTSRFSPSCSSLRSDHLEKLVDNPGCFWCYEKQISSNIHRGMILSTGALPRP